MRTKNVQTKFTILALVAAFTFSLGATNKAFSATADYYKCSARVGGEYNYGRAPQACNASAFGEDKVVVNTYGKLVFDDTDTRTSERSRYVNEMNAVVKEAAAYYLKKRKPNVSATELSWWVLGIQATASHESYWSHYRKATDARIKMMRGDYGHGHGMMQIDDRAHFSVITSGIAWNLISNMTYAMDIFYKQWERAPSESCVKTPTNYEARVRSAWAAYNGGSGKICRWKNPYDKWAENDRNFYTHYSKRLWEKYVTNSKQKASIDVGCLIEKKENCPAPGTVAEVPALKTGILYKNSNSYCVVNNNKATCVSEFRDAICLKHISAYTSTEAVTVKDSVLATYSPVVLDRHQICAQYEPTIFAVGASLVVQKTMNLRATPGGGVVIVVPQYQSLVILDFELRNAPSNDRYYKVKYQNKEGYLFAGAKTDYQSWATLDTSSQLPSSIARVGEYIKVVNNNGINQRTEPGGAVLRLIPKGTQLQVLEVFVESTNNKVYYKVSYQGQVGYAYTGLLLPTDTTAEWTQVLR